MAAAAMVESSREKYVYMARLAEQAGRYEEMLEFMEKVTKGVEVEELTVEECKLLFAAYKNLIGACRASWRVISSIEQDEESRGNEEHLVPIRKYRAKVEAELCNFCEGILPLLDSHLDSHPIYSSTAAESKVFYLKMKGDYHRYIAEFKTGAEKEEAAENTELAYKSAQDIAAAELAPMHPLRLGLANNFSLFYYEILNSPDRAYNLAKQALDVASAEFDSCENEMQLLHDTCRRTGRKRSKNGEEEIKTGRKRSKNGEEEIKTGRKRSKRHLSVRTGRNNSEM